MLDQMDHLGSLIGNTPLHKLQFGQCNLFTKLEHMNLFGSIKDRPAHFILKNAIAGGEINADTTVIESTSGNFGIALAGICRAIGLKFIAVIDPNISRQKEQMLNMMSYDVIRVKEPDETGGYLLNRIKKVRSFISQNKNAYNPNQYENPNNYLSYYHTIGNELINSFSRLDYLFISVSSGGTVIGLSNRIKETFSNCRIIAVDIEGSMIFNNTPKERKISGIGASMRSALMDKALIDDVVILTQIEILEGCHELFFDHSLFLGPSSGAAYMAVKKVLGSRKLKPGVNAVFISPDNGYSYLDSIYSEDWVNRNIAQVQHEIFK